MYDAQLKRNFFRASIQNNAGEPLNMLITWAPDMGSIDIAADLGRLLDTFQIRFAVMTGICAGNKDRGVKLGDLIVAERTYLYDSGSEQRFNARTIQISPTILHFARGFEEWQDEGSQLSRPPSKRQQRDWLLNILLEKKRIQAIDPTIRDTNAPEWRTIVHELQQGEKPFLDTNLQLIDEQQVMDLLYGPEEFPYRDSSEPACHIGTVASGSSVRKDNLFPANDQPASKVLGFDMECWAFYYMLQERHKIHSLFVKGVCDYGDGNKSDSYHDYAATLSTIYALAFIQKYVTSELMPTSNATKAQENVLDIYVSFAPEDQDMRDDLLAALAPLSERGVVFHNGITRNYATPEAEKRLQVGDAIVTPSGSLAARCVIHSRITDNDGGITHESIVTCALAALRKAEELGDIHTIALPAPGSGFAGLDATEIAPVLLRAIADYLRSTTQIQQVIFVFTENATYRAYIDAYRALGGIIEETPDQLQNRAFRLSIKISPENIAIGAQVQLYIEPHPVPPSPHDKDIFELPEQIAEVYCFVRANGLYLLDTEVKPLLFNPLTGELAGADFLLQAYLHGTRTCTIELFVEDPATGKIVAS